MGLQLLKHPICTMVHITNAELYDMHEVPILSLGIRPGKRLFENLMFCTIIEVERSG
jgi:FlaA1/EpsC-like NDP-sugar epimerase